MDKVDMYEIDLEAQKAIKQLIDEHQLKSDFYETVETYYLQVAKAIACEKKTKKALLVGVNGAQGTGKSTIASFLVSLLKNVFKLNSVCFSIDDIYLTQKDRQDLADTIHPLFKTRGVPGTHDVEMGINLIKHFKQLKAGETLASPIFNKAIDDRADESTWPLYEGPIDIIILEGWCVGAVAQYDNELTEAVNDLERLEDTNAKWRCHVNEQLKTTYQDLFNMIDFLVMLKAPSFEKVYDWRLKQERKLALKVAPSAATAIMDAKDIKRFIMHYERLTRHILAEMPERANICLTINDDHKITSIIQ